MRKSSFHVWFQIHCKLKWGCLIWSFLHFLAVQAESVDSSICGIVTHSHSEPLLILEHMTCHWMSKSYRENFFKIFKNFQHFFSFMNCLEYWYCISETGWMWNRGVGVGEQAESSEEYPSKWKLIFKLNLKVYLQINMKICLQIQCENIPSNLSSKIRLSGMPCIDQNRVKVNFSLAPVFEPANHIKPNLSLLPWQPFVKS